MTHSSESGNSRQPADYLSHARIVDAGGTQAFVVSLEHAGADTLAWIRVGDGPQIRVPVSLLTLEPDGVYRLPFSFGPPVEENVNAQVTFPVHEERLHIGKRMVDTGRGVRIHKTVLQREQIVDQPLLQDELVVEHVPVDALVADADLPQTRYEGDTLVVPVLEEVLVVQKRMRLKEEVRITRRKRETHAPQSVLLRSEQVAVERFDESRRNDPDAEKNGQA